MNQDEYRCDKCKQVFTKTRREEEALKEFKKIFPNVTPTDRVIVCEDCYVKIMVVWEEIKENRRSMR